MFLVGWLALVMSQLNNIKKESVLSLNLFKLQPNSSKKSQTFFQRVFSGFLVSKKSSVELLKKSRGLLNRSNVLHRKIYERASDVKTSIASLAESTNHYTQEIKSHSTLLKKEKEFLFEQNKQFDSDKKKLDEKSSQIRKEEILLATRKSENAKQYKEVKQIQKEIQAKEDWINSESERLQSLEEEQKAKQEELDFLQARFEKQEREIEREKESVDEILLELEERKNLFEEEYSLFQKERKDWKAKLEEKIIEYEKKLEDIEKIKSTVNLFKKDQSKEGKQAKLVVQEAIRQMQKLAKDNYEKSLELEEKYCKGTFKGFAIPVVQIEEKIEILKEHLQEITNYASANIDLPLESFISEIQSRLKKADEFKDLWDFPNSFTSAVEGIGFCLSFEIFLKSLNDWASKSTETEFDDNSSEKEIQDYYEILGVSLDASQDEIKKAYRELIKQYHPDKVNPDLPEEEKEKYKEIFLRIQKAYEVLSDETRKKEYDSKRTKGESK